MKQLGIWVAITIVIIVAVFGLIKLSNSSSSSTNSGTMPPINSQDETFGNPKAKVQLVEYADFQCPACLAEYPELKKFMNDYKNKVLFVYRYFPLIQVHRNAMVSAQAAYAASKQGKFWQMHDKLFDTQNDWANIDNPQSIFESYAKSLGLNLNQFQKDFADQNGQNLINNEENGGVNAGVDATPTLFINGNKVQADHPLSYDELKSTIDPLLK